MAPAVFELKGSHKIIGRDQYYLKASLLHTQKINCTFGLCLSAWCSEYSFTSQKNIFECVLLSMVEQFPVVQQMAPVTVDSLTLTEVTVLTFKNIDITDLPL